ncbi:hypothetical protein H4R19_001379 [Coemansia spiralis]|nr:hypothetical protein H4R19_001379 [Coemansia spiralis]
MRFSLVSPVAALAVSLSGAACAGLSGCPQNLAFQLTNVFQFGDITFVYDKCATDSVRGGYRAGIANFNTADGSAWSVINTYHGMTGGNDEFSKFDAVLQKRGKFDGSSSTSSSLDGFCTAWKAASKSSKFRSAQSSVFTDKYFDKSQSIADSLGLTLSVSRAQLYDAAISHGTGSQKNGLAGMIQATNKNITKDISGVSGSPLDIKGFQVDEVKWLQRFLSVRSAYTDAPGAKASVNSYNYIINNMLTAYTSSGKDRSVFQWDIKLNALSDAGTKVSVDCEHNFSDNSPIPIGGNNGGPVTRHDSTGDAEPMSCAEKTSGQWWDLGERVCSTGTVAAGVSLAAVLLAVALAV